MGGHEALAPSLRTHQNNGVFWGLGESCNYLANKDNHSAYDMHVMSCQVTTIFGTKLKSCGMHDRVRFDQWDVVGADRSYTKPINGNRRGTHRPYACTYELARRP